MGATTVHSSSSAELPATITVCGRPSRDTLAALLELAMTAGLGVIVQPQPRPTAPLLLEAPIVDVVQVRRGRPRGAARRGARRPSHTRRRTSKASDTPPVSRRPVTPAAAGDLETRILAQLEVGPARARAIATTLGVKSETVRAALKLLKSAGRVDVRGVTSGATWCLKSAPLRQGESLMDARRRVDRAREEYVSLPVGKASLADTVTELRRRAGGE